MINTEIFREYDIRGVADTDLNETTVIATARALGTFFLGKGVKSVAIGHDCRVSSNRVHQNIQDGLLSTGINVVSVGMVPTPLVYFANATLTQSHGIGGAVMITGSHNPPQYNGFKICLGPGTLYGEDIQKIRALALGATFASGKGKASTFDIRTPYIEYVIRNIRTPLSLTIASDPGNGTAGVVTKELFSALGCKVHEIFSEPDGRFPNHHPDPTEEHNLHDLKKLVAETKAAVGVGFDGDSDRIGVIDQTGRIIFGDELLVLFARSVLKKNPGATIISEVKASHRLFQDIAKHGGKPLLWKTGHSLIKAKMRETGALLAGEMSGHVFFGDRFFGFDDAIYSAARLFEILSETGKTPLELLRDLPPSYSTPEIRKECADALKFRIVSEALARFRDQGLQVNAIDGARVEFENGWGLVRASNTQPVLVFRFESDSPEGLEKIRDHIESTVVECQSRITA